MVGERPGAPHRSARRKRLLTRAAPIGGIAVLAFAVGVVAATAPGRAERRLATRYVSAWAHGDFPKMYSMLDSASRQQTTEAQFVAAYRAAAATATLVSIAPGHVGNKVGDVIPVRVRVRTSVFGTLREILDVPLAGSGSGASVKFSPAAAVPGAQSRGATDPAHASAGACGAARQRRDSARAGPGPDLADPGRRRSDRRHARPDSEDRGRELCGARLPRGREGRDRRARADLPGPRCGQARRHACGRQARARAHHAGRR